MPLLDIPTLMMCLLVGWFIIGLLTYISFTSEPSRQELKIWSAGFAVGGLGVLLLSLRGFVPAFWSVGVGNAALLAGVGLLWQGFRSFDGKSTHCGAMFLFGGIWMGAYLGSPAFSGNINLRIIASSVLLSIELGLMALAIWQGYRREALPTRKLLVFFLAAYVLVNLMRIPMTLIFPVGETEGQPVSVWYGLMTFMLHVISLMCGVGIFSLSRDRVLLEYKRASETDGLTGALNRRAFMDRLGVEIGPGGCLALIDIDHFKAINDNHGHAAGDLVLRQFVSRVNGQLGPGMVFGRVGGEEFGLFLKGFDSQKALAFCEALRQDLHNEPFTWHDHSVRATVSMGLKQVEPGGAETESQILAADSALYAAKNGGRNRVVCHDAIARQSPPGAEASASNGFAFSSLAPQAG
ncbi:GGDEF domain-containing protein [Allorhizobium undicola]|uniref:GGDEF domain-containing protein n=1 Tax=Allorhizobium undicola TaxID=78527 RepID=UPI003D350C0F